MSHTSPSRYPIPTNTVLPSSSATLNAAGLASQFTPRKEFIPNHRVASTFSLLTLSGTGFVRLYSFPGIVVSGLRRLFDQHNLITSVREHAPRHFFEFALEGKPWANPKSIKSEKLVVDILAVIFYFGYAFLSTIDYGREQDDRLALAFSKPLILPTSPTVPLPNASAVSLQQPIRVPFAISFSSQTTMRVIGPPLHSTPAVLQAVRGAWPRGVLSEKKVGDATYEFKLKGYKWFQEDTFATDSLHHILGLLSALDIHGFTLLTSLPLVNRSRVKDMWVFTGLADERHPDSPLPSPDNSSLELKRQITPQTQGANSMVSSSLVPGHPPIGTSRPLPIPHTSSPIADVSHHVRSPSDTVPATSSPLKPPSPPFMKAPFSLLRRYSQKASSQVANVPERAEEDITLSPEQSPRIPPSVMDMTGVGSGHRRSSDNQRSPDIFYSTNGRANGYFPPAEHPFHTVPSPGQIYPPFTSNGRTGPDRKRRSLPISRSPEGLQTRKGDSSEKIFPPRPPSVQPSPQPSRLRRSSTPPVSTPAPPGIKVQTPSPVVASSSLRNKSLNSPNALRYGTESNREPLTDTPRTPTPYLLNPGVFRDSAFSTSTIDRQSYDIPITLARRDYESQDGLRSKERADDDGQGQVGQDRNGQPHLRSGQGHPDSERALGPSSFSAWSSAPREDFDLANPNMFLPPTIREQPSQEQDDFGASTMAAMKINDQPTPDRLEGVVRSMPPERISPRGESARKSEAASVGLVNTSGSGSLGRSTKNTAASTPGVEKKEHRTAPTRKETSTSGWVMVNVESHGNGKPNTLDKSKDKTSNRTHHKLQTDVVPSPSPVSNTGRPIPHRRSSSDSRIPSRSTSGAPQDTRVAPSTMSAAAKTIVMIDAIEARRQQDKPGTGSAFKRLWGRATGSPDPKTNESSTPASTVSLRPKVTPDDGVGNTRVGPRDEQAGLKKRRGVPTASSRRVTDKRLSID